MGYLILALTIVVYILRPAEWIPALYFNWNMLLNGIGVLVVFFAILDKNDKVLFDRTILYFLWFVFAMVLSNIVRLQFSTIGEYLPQMVTNLIVFALVQITLTDIERARRFIVLIVLLLLFVCYQCYLQVQVGSNWGGLEPFYRSILVATDDGVVKSLEPQVKWFGILSDPNDLGMILIAFVPYIFSRIVFQELTIWKKTLWTLSLFVLIYTVVLTNSRGSLLALIVGVCAFFVIKKRSVAGIVAACVAAAVLLALGPSRMGEIGSGDNSAMGRVYAWILSLELFAMNPVLGVGADHFLDYHGRTAHNSYVLAFVETGILGFIGYLSVFILSIGTALKVAFRVEDMRKSIEIIALASGLIGILVSIFFISRTYVLLPFMYAALLTTYCKVCCPDIFSEQIKAIKIPFLIFCSVSFIIFVYIFNRLSTMLLL